MVSIPDQSVVYSIMVPTRDAATKVPSTLASRGHRMVSIRQLGHKDLLPRPRRASERTMGWDVLSLVIGPEPDDDTAWWKAKEREALRELARHYEGYCDGHTTSSSRESGVRRFHRDGLVHELDDETASKRRLDVLQTCSPRAPRPQCGQDVVVEDLPSGPGHPVLLDGVEDVDWGELQHAYGDAVDVSGLLLNLSRNDQNWAEAHSELIYSVLHQGSVYTSTAPAMTFLARIAASPTLSGGRRLNLLYDLFLAGAQQSIAEANGYDLGTIGPKVRDAVVSQVEQLLKLWPAVSRAEKRLLLLLAALGPVKQSVLEQPDLGDPASQLANAVINDLGSADSLLSEMAGSYEDLIEYTEGGGNAQARLIAALAKLLWL